jgi:hypothetical protein
VILALATFALVSGMLVLTLSPQCVSAEAPSGLREAGEGAVVELRGRVVCLGEDLAPGACAGASLRFALETLGGERLAFRTGDALSAIFADDQVRERELSVRARKTASDELETVKVYSVRNGKLNDLDYFCEVCNIVAYAPGLCPCCRRPMVLRETPLP